MGAEDYTSYCIATDRTFVYGHNHQVVFEALEDALRYTPNPTHLLVRPGFQVLSPRGAQARVRKLSLYGAPQFERDTHLIVSGGPGLSGRQSWYIENFTVVFDVRACFEEHTGQSPSDDRPSSSGGLHLRGHARFHAVNCHFTLAEFPHPQTAPTQMHRKPPRHGKRGKDQGNYNPVHSEGGELPGRLPGGRQCVTARERAMALFEGCTFDPGTFPMDVPANRDRLVASARCLLQSDGVSASELFDLSQLETPI